MPFCVSPAALLITALVATLVLTSAAPNTAVSPPTLHMTTKAHDGAVGGPLVGDARLINPRLFGFSSYLGPIVNLSYIDPAVTRVARVIRMGSLRCVHVRAYRLRSSNSSFFTRVPRFTCACVFCRVCTIISPHSAMECNAHSPCTLVLINCTKQETCLHGRTLAMVLASPYQACSFILVFASLSR